MHVQMTFHPIAEDTIKQLDKAQSEGKAPSENLVSMIKDPTISSLISKHQLADEMFPTCKDCSKEDNPKTPEK